MSLDSLIRTGGSTGVDPLLLAGVGGAGLVGSATYASIRAYTGDSTAINCSGRENVFDMAHGVFVRDLSDTTSPDNDGTILIDALGRRWKRQLSGFSAPEWFGAKGDAVANDSPAMTSALSLGMSVKCLSQTYRLTSKVDLIEPFDFDGNNAEFMIDHAGDGLYVKSSVYANKRNICSLLNVNFIPGAITPNSLITIGEATVLEPTNIQLDGIHFQYTFAGQSHIVNKRSYGLKINNSAFNEVVGTCILFESGVGGDGSRYSYNCYIGQVDITGCTHGVIVEGGKINISNSVIESCTGRALWAKGSSFNASIYVDNVYFENNVYSLYFESQQPQGYTRNSEIRNSFFAGNSGLCYASDNNDIRLSNNKGFTFDRVTGSGNWSLAGTQFPVPYNATTCPTSRLRFESPVRVEYDVIQANTRNIVPYFNLRKVSSGRLGTAMKITIVRQSGASATYYQAILLPTATDGTSWREIVIASSSVGGIIANPSYERSGDVNNMNLYFYFTQPAVTIVTIEGDGGFC
ncbi:putative tail spike protein [Aeromonas phage Aer_P220]|uniref:Tail spike protein n=1 Tax=Aeromonas phage Aer_P220 TaxID=2951227 RepID=A0A9E7NNI8_9CAUD|nr:putative tail spike protein [Aeromonas phage Aer_P220]